MDKYYDIYQSLLCVGDKVEIIRTHTVAVKCVVVKINKNKVYLLSEKYSYVSRIYNYVREGDEYVVDLNHILYLEEHGVYGVFDFNVQRKLENE